MNIPIELLTMFVALSFAVGILGIILALKKIAGSPFIIMFAGILLFSQLAIVTNIEGVSDDSVATVGTNTTTYMNQPTRTGAITLRHGINIFIGEEVDSTSSLSTLVNKEINAMEVTIDRTGNNLNGTIYAGVWNTVSRPTLNNVLYNIGQVNANDTNINISQYLFIRNDTRLHRLMTQQAVGIFYDGGDSSNFITVDTNGTSSSFDADRARTTVFNNATKIWTDTTISDLKMKIQSIKPDGTTTTFVKYPFNQNDTYVFFILFGALFILIGFMVQMQKW